MQTKNIFSKTLISICLSSALLACGSSSDNSSEPISDVNSIPTADAGNNQTVKINELVSVSAELSSDPEGDPLTYQWTFETTPVGSGSQLLNSTNQSSSFTPDTVGTYTLSLVVNDGTNDSAEVYVTITASEQVTSILDITDIKLTSRAGSCSDYVGEYISNVSDIKRNMAFNGSISIKMDGDNCNLIVNEIPNHDFNDETASFATNVSKQTGSYQIDSMPNMANTVTDITLGTRNGVFLNGVMVDLLAAACYDIGNEPLGREKIGCGPDQIENPWRYDPMSVLNGFGTDQHNAHTQPDGTYHYHGNPLALFDIECEANATESPVIGFASDGYPIFGPCINDNGVIREASSSFVLKSGTRQTVSGYTTPVAGVGAIESNHYDGQFRGDYEYSAASGDLDECNGMTVNGQYGYYITNAFPWVLNCFKGTPDPSFTATGPGLTNLMHSHNDGEVHSH
jgi:hypothetical protein